MNLTAFLKPNVEPVEDVKFAPSTRFKGEDGKPVEWQIRCISADEYARIRNSCIRQIPVPGKKHQFTQDLDTRTFQAKMVVRCTAFPNLDNAELQSSWDVLKAEDLVGAMLTAGEFDDYFTEVMRVNGFQAEAELVDTAKN